LQEYSEKLKRSNLELEQFAMVASHDLQEPLRKIKFFALELQRQFVQTLPDDAHDYMRRIQNAVERMQTMIDGLLELSRVTTRGEEFAIANLTALVDEVILDLEARIKASGGQVFVDSLPSAEVDSIQIRRLFQNLIGNGLKFHKPDVPPVVRILDVTDLSFDRGSITISVQDNGIGLDEQYAERIFQPFQRLHGMSEYEGTGLGLAISRKIIERHHGTLEVRSQPNQGAEFIITLPVWQPVR
jgi:light-regulated signal transduction histidine kinase (bacteriophytochrome)